MLRQPLWLWALGAGRHILPASRLDVQLTPPCTTIVQEDGAAVDLDSQRQGKCVVLKTSTRQTIFLPVVGLVDATKLKPGDLVGVNKDSYLILDTLPAEYDSRVKAMEVRRCAWRDGQCMRCVAMQAVLSLYATYACTPAPETEGHACPACGRVTSESTPPPLQVDEKPSEDYSDVGGLDKQIKELVEAIVLPVTHKDKFKALGIRPPKGVLYYGQ
jgi:Proteasomal ATPase OB C-terminal domain